MKQKIFKLLGLVSFLFFIMISLSVLYAFIYKTPPSPKGALFVLFLSLGLTFFLNKIYKTKTSSKKRLRRLITSAYLAPLVRKETKGEPLFHALSGTMKNNSISLCGLAVEKNKRIWYNSFQKKITCEACISELGEDEVGYDESKIDSMSA